MNNDKDESDSSRSRDTQVDLFTLIGGSWPPAPQPPQHHEYHSAPIPRHHTMHRPSQNERIKSVNLIEHMVPSRRNKQASEEAKKMVYDQKKVETGILVDVCSSENPHGVHNSTAGSPGSSVSRPSPNSRNLESGVRVNNIDQNQYVDLRWNEALNNEGPEELYDSPALGSPRAVPVTPTSPTEHIQLQDEIGVGSLVEVATDVDQHHYGVVRWIGIIDETATAGVELEQSVCGLGDGTRGGTRVFACAPGRALFVPLALCRRDARFRDTPPPRPPADNTASDTDRQWALYVHPVYVGDYPPVVKEKVAAKSAAQGYSRSRLIELSPDEVEYIRGTSDIFGLNHYSTNYVYRNASVFGAHESPSLYDDAEILTYQLQEWKIGESNFTKYVPWGFYKLLIRIKEDYNNPPVYIIENGCSTPSGLNDDDRIQYYRGYLSAMLDAIEAGADVQAYTAWSMMDNFEWLFGYSERFGLYEVDYNDPNRTRTPRKSAFVYKHILRTRQLDMHYEPDTWTMTIDEGL